MSKVSIDTHNACVDFPIFDAKSRSLKKAFLGKAGGAIGRTDSDVVVVEALNDITMSLKEGDRVGLVGHNGAGKSTLLRLLSGIYEPTRGTILLDNTDIREISLRSLRTLTGIVSQDTVVFNDTVRNNMAYGATGKFTDEQIIAAAKAARISSGDVKRPVTASLFGSSFLFRTILFAKTPVS